MNIFLFCLRNKKINFKLCTLIQRSQFHFWHQMHYNKIIEISTFVVTKGSFFFAIIGDWNACILCKIALSAF